MLNRLLEVFHHQRPDMAEHLNDGVFWLPSDFLDDDLFQEGDPTLKGPGAPFPKEISFGAGPDLNSSSESLTEGDSDEEEYLAGLTRRMARAFLDAEEDNAVFHGSNPKVMASSPQSTLCAVEGWSSSSRGSPSGPSQVTSPRSVPLEQSVNRSCNLLYAAAGQVMRMRLEEQETHTKYRGRGILSTPIKQDPVMHSASQIRTAGYYGNALPAATLQQLEFERLKQEQLMKQQISAAWVNRSKVRADGGFIDGRRGRTLGLPSSAWPSLQQQLQQPPLPPAAPQPGAGMRAIFLNGPHTRRESSGTGVFLPRRAGSANEPRKKPACSTVLLPARVVQALNLNLDELNASCRNSRFPGGYVVDHDVALSRAGAPHQKRNHYRPPPATAANYDVRLPPEWTY